MLNYSNTWVLESYITSQWKTISNILDIPMPLILKSCYKVYIEFQDPNTSDIYYLELYSIPANVLLQYQNISSFLQDNIDYINNQENLASFINFSDFQLVNYYNLFDSNYSVDIGTSLPSIYSPQQNLILKNDAYPISNNYVNKYDLITINGFIHNYFINENNKIEVINGGNTFLNLIGSQLGVLDFSNIGSLTRIPFNSTAIINQDNLFNDTQINIPEGYNPEQNTLVLIVGGYMCFIDNDIIYIDENNIIHIDFSELNFVNRYIETSLYLDIETLAYENEIIYFSAYGEGFNGEGGYSCDTGCYEGAITNTLITTYIDNTPCMFVIINNPNVQLESYFPHLSNFPGLIESNIEPIYPLVTYTGRIVEYTHRRENNKYIIRVRDKILEHIVFVGSDYYTNNTFYGNWYQENVNYSKNVFTSTAAFLKIYTQTG